MRWFQNMNQKHEYLSSMYDMKDFCLSITEDQFDKILEWVDRMKGLLRMQSDKQRKHS